MNFIEACKQLKEDDNAEYIYRESVPFWLYSFCEAQHNYTKGYFLQQAHYNEGRYEWTNCIAQLYDIAITANDWVVKYKEEKLKDCPFCGSSLIIIIDCDSNDYIVRCGNCLVKTRCVHGRDFVIELWNKRAKDQY
jgi:hypothetical protein